MPTMAKISLIGHLGKDPELKQTKGDPVCNFSVATNRKVGDEDQVTWWRVACWGKQAENVAKYLHKGSLVFVEGEAGLREYQDRDGATRTSLEVSYARVLFLDRKPDGEQRSAGSAQGGAARQSGRDDEPPPPDDGDVPF